MTASLRFLDRLGDPIEARREFDGQTRDVDAEVLQAPDGPVGSNARNQVTAGVGRERLGKAEVRVKLSIRRTHRTRRCSARASCASCATCRQT